MATKTKSPMIEAHMARLKSIEGKKAEAGWFESDRYPAAKGKAVGEQVAFVARVQEFGTTIERTINGNAVKIVIPARAFMRKAWLDFSKARVNLQAKLAKRVVDGEITPDEALGQIGLALEGFIVKSIKRGEWEPNAPSTIAKKGFNKPLIDTAHMWKSVSSKVS